MIDADYCTGCRRLIHDWQEQPVPGWHLSCAVHNHMYEVRCKNCFDRPWATNCLWCGGRAYRKETTADQVGPHGQD